ncbi:MAG: prephenate dehydratase [Candidatus Competibacterales bacterium]|nr:prephenate dehydratase [Candidatus Competibacterales bacterium]
MADDASLQALRARIDALDAELQRLLSERAECALEVARIKQDGGDRPLFYRPEREAQILRRVRERNQGPLSNRTLLRLFREIIGACLALEQTLTVAYLGPAGTFTQAAVLAHFGHAVRTTPLPAIDDVFREVEAEAADFGVVPVENSTEGVVGHTLDRLVHSSLCICGEILLPIHQQLLSRAAGLKEIERIYAHQQSLAQCREWLDANLTQVERIPVASNGEAARLAAKDSSSAAIAGRIAAELNELSVLAANIEDDPENATRFLVLGRQPVDPSGHDKTTLLVAAPNRPGLLHRLLAPIADNGVNMTRIESRPSRRARWDYLFFIDLEGHAEDPAVARTLRELERIADFCRVLGAYPTDINS